MSWTAFDMKRKLKSFEQTTFWMFMGESMSICSNFDSLSNNFN